MKHKVRTPPLPAACDCGWRGTRRLTWVGTGPLDELERRAIHYYQRQPHRKRCPRCHQKTVFTSITTFERTKGRPR